MGLWDHQLADLEALGLRFSDEEVQALEDPPEGLRVMHLQPLWDPDTPEGQVCFVEDPNGGVIYVPEVLDLVHPTAPHSEYKGAPMWEVMESEHGIMDEGYPFYMATLDWNLEVIETPLSYYRTDEPKPYPFHGCLPLLSDMESDAAARLIDYARNMIRDSLYDELDFLCRFERDSEWCVQSEDVWAEAVMNVELPPDRAFMIQEHLDDHGDPDVMRQTVVVAFQRLIDDGFIKDPRFTPEQEEAYVHVPMKIGPLEDYIPDSDFVAKDLYLSILKRQRHFQRRWEQVRGKYPLLQLLAREGVYV